MVQILGNSGGEAMQTAGRAGWLAGIWWKICCPLKDLATLRHSDQANKLDMVRGSKADQRRAKNSKQNHQSFKELPQSVGHSCHNHGHHLKMIELLLLLFTKTSISVQKHKGFIYPNFRGYQAFIWSRLMLATGRLSYFQIYFNNYTEQMEHKTPTQSPTEKKHKTNHNWSQCTEWKKRGTAVTHCYIV